MRALAAITVAPEMLLIDRLALDGGCQPRAGKLLDVIDDYAAAMISGADFPPVTVFYDGADYWLADGYHRRDAAVAAGYTEILADIRQGTRRDAILFAVGANAAHGLRRTNEDKRRAVLTLLNDQEWSGWSDREIARRCGVNLHLVAQLRPPVTESSLSEQRTYTTKHGTVSTMNTARIGGRPAFDRSDFAQAEPEECDLVPPRFVDSAAEVEHRDGSHDHIWHGLRDLIETIKGLPAPSEVAQRLPREFEHSIRAEDVIAAAEWLAEFAPLWAAGQQERDQRTGAMVERARGMMANVTAR